MPPTDTGTHRLRSDARRNRDHILAIAQELFAEHGVTVSLDGLAKRAGVGAGTLYRHFPNRESLLAALLAAREEHLGAQLAAITAEASDAGDALRRWLVALEDWATAFDGLPGPLRDALSAEASPLTLGCEGYVSTTDRFLAAAQQEGSARPEVRGRELFLMTLAIGWARSAALADEASPAALSELLRTGWATPAGAGG